MEGRARACYDGPEWRWDGVGAVSNDPRVQDNYRRWLYALVVLFTIIGGLYLSNWAYGVLRAGSSILALYFMAWLLQFFLTPLVDFLTRRHVPRIIAVSYVYLMLALVVVIALVSVTPVIYGQGQRLARELAKPETYMVIQNTALGIEKFLEQHLGVRHQDISAFTKSYSVNFKNGALNAGKSIRDIIQGYLNFSNIGRSATTFFSFIGTINAIFLNLVIVLILAFYMTLDGHKLMHRVMAYFPPAVGEVMESVNGIINRKFGGYLRGQVILASSYGLLTYLIAQGFGLPYPIFIAAFAAVMMLIPFVGTFAAIVPPILAYVLMHLTTATFSPLGFLLLLVFLFGSQQIVLNVLAPRVMSSAVGMHPLLVVLGLLLGVKLAGIWGAIFGVPIFGVVAETADLIYRRVMERRFGFRPPDSTQLNAEESRQPRQPSAGRGSDTVDEESRDGEPARLPKAGVTLHPAPGPPDTRT